MKQILTFFPDQNTKSNAGKEVKHVEESQRNGHHLSDEQHQQQQRPSKQTNNQNRRDRDRGGDPRGGNGSHMTAQNSSNTVHTGNSSRGGSENHEIHEFPSDEEGNLRVASVNTVYPGNNNISNVH